MMSQASANRKVPSKTSQRLQLGRRLTTRASSKLASARASPRRPTRSAENRPTLASRFSNRRRPRSQARGSQKSILTRFTTTCGGLRRTSHLTTRCCLSIQDSATARSSPSRMNGLTSSPNLRSASYLHARARDDAGGGGLRAFSPEERTRESASRPASRRPVRNDDDRAARAAAARAARRARRRQQRRHRRVVRAQRRRRPEQRRASVVRASGGGKESGGGK